VFFSKIPKKVEPAAQEFQTRTFENTSRPIAWPNINPFPTQDYSQSRRENISHGINSPTSKSSSPNYLLKKVPPKKEEPAIFQNDIPQKHFERSFQVRLYFLRDKRYIYKKNNRILISLLHKKQWINHIYNNLIREIIVGTQKCLKDNHQIQSKKEKTLISLKRPNSLKRISMEFLTKI
jgi:hypothetical protein